MRTGRLFKPGSFRIVSSTAFTAFTTMLSSFLHAFLVTLVTFAFAVAVSATPSLTVRTSTPNAKVNGIEQLEIIATVVNTDNKTLKLLNDPRGVLDPFPGNSFNIVNAAGSCPLFHGAVVIPRLFT
jgi:peptidyl-Lys metalloendopeptidase